MVLFNTLTKLNSTIRKLWLYRNRLGDECIPSLGEYIKANKTIEIMSIGSNMITDNGIESLVPYFEGNTTFKYLSLYGSRIITDKAISSLMPAPLTVSCSGGKYIQKSSGKVV